MKNKQLQSERNILVRRIEHLLEVPMIFLGFVWLMLLAAEFIWGITPILETISIAIWIIFILDFVLKFSLAPSKRIYLKKNWLTAISLLIPALRIFRAFRVFRVLRGVRSVRLVRVVSSLNRSMRSLNATMQRRGFKYVVVLTLAVIFGGAAGMFGFEKEVSGFNNYGDALWWTAMIVITMGTDYWPVTPEGKMLSFILALYGFSILGYITATLASFFVGRDAEEKSAPLAGSDDLAQIKKQLEELTIAIYSIKKQDP
ncbi:MAG TPA: ion transporter [Chitinophagaceae bacterium]